MFEHLMETCAECAEPLHTYNICPHCQLALCADCIVAHSAECEGASPSLFLQGIIEAGL